MITKHDKAQHRLLRKLSKCDDDNKEENRKWLGKNLLEGAIKLIQTIYFSPIGFVALFGVFVLILLNLLK